MKKLSIYYRRRIYHGNFSAFSQNHKTAADTIKLNKEEVSNDIADLTSKLTIVQNNFPVIKTKPAKQLQMLKVL